MRITDIEAHPVWIPTKGDYRMATSAHKGLHTLVVVMRTDGGVVGHGESHQAVGSYSAETANSMRAVIDLVYAPLLVGRELEALEQIVTDMAIARRGNLFARCAIETALHDALARSRGQNVTTLLGGPVRTRMQLCGIIGLDEPDVMAEKASVLAAAGYRTIKAKIGASGIAKDIERVRAIRRALSDSVALRLDANAAYAPTDAMTLVRSLGDMQVEYIEQPVPADQLAALANLTRLGAVPILADESVHTPEDAYRVVAMQAVDAIKIKLTKVGGFIGARKIVNICEAAGVKVVVGQGMCSSLEAAAELQMACTYPAICAVGEMVGPAKLQDDLANPGLDVSQGYAALPAGMGIGVELSEASLAKYSLV